MNLSKFVSSDIEDVINVRLCEDNVLEFKIHPSGENGTMWIKENTIARQTLRSKKFKSFFENQGDNIHDSDDLRNLLKENININQHDLDDDVDIDESKEHGKMIKLKIKNKTALFSIEQLRVLSYFNVMFCDRWMKNRNLEKTIIDIFGENNDNSSNINNIHSFDFIHLKWLLKCGKVSKIRDDLPRDCELIEGLINCNDFLMNKQDSIINVETLVDYFKTSKPRMSPSDTRKLKQEATNTVLLQALNCYIQELDDKLQEMRRDLANNHSTIESLSRIRFDNTTALLLLKEKLQFEIEKNVQEKTTSIMIKNFTNKDDYVSLINSVNKKYLLTQMEPLIKIIDEINDPEIESYKICISNDIHATIQGCLSKGIHNIDPEDVNFQARLLGACMAKWKLCFRSGRAMIRPCAVFGNRLLQLNTHGIEQFTTMVFGTNDLLVKESIREITRKNHCQLRKMCLLNCSHEWIVNNMELWFPTIHKNDKQSVEWIMNDIVNSMNSDRAWNFGIYLTKYIAYKWNSKDKFPQQYLDFLKNDLEIDWDLMCDNE